MTGNNANSLPQNNLKDIVYEPSRDCLYIGTYMGGVSVLDIKSGKFTNLLSLSILRRRSVRAIASST